MVLSIPSSKQILTIDTMAAAFSNVTILDQLRSGAAQFELDSSPLRSIIPESNSLWTSNAIQWLGNINNNSHRFFARIGPPQGSPSASSLTKKAEHYSIRKVTGDGRCMFRALVKGMSLNKGITVASNQEREDADELRAAVKEVLCEDKVERSHFEEAVIAITVDEPLHRYCQRIGRSDFWGGESELLVLSRLCRQPITVYIPESEVIGNGRGFIPIAEYGAEYQNNKAKSRKRVKLLYSGRNHYDLLV